MGHCAGEGGGTVMVREACEDKTTGSHLFEARAPDEVCVFGRVLCENTYVLRPLIKGGDHVLDRKVTVAREFPAGGISVATPMRADAPVQAGILRSADHGGGHIPDRKVTVTSKLPAGGM